MTTIEVCIDELVASGVIDWVNSYEVAVVAAQFGGATTDDDNRRLSLRLIAEVVRRGLMEVGDLDTVRRGFRRWELETEEALARIEREWPAAGPSPVSSEICWLNNTAHGDLRGERHLSRTKGSA